jgi:pimeloyl-ACP methyl ester carboxylesterase
MTLASIRNIGTFASVALLAACSSAQPGSEAEGAETTGTVQSALDSDVTFPVAIRGTGTATIHAHVYLNPAAGAGATVLAVPGLSETATIYGPLAQAIFADRALGRVVKRIVSIDFPGLGASSFPAGLPAGVNYGDLLIDDNVGVVVQAIGALKQLGLGASVAIGHSMGGLEIQGVQAALLANGSSLAAHGIVGAALLAPVPPHAQQWSYVANPSALASFIVTDPTLGSYVAIPPAVFIPLAFSTPSGQVVPDAPTAAQVAAAGYVGPEPLAVETQLVEAPVPLPDGGSFVIPRPTVPAKALALGHGTVTSVVSFAQDTLVPAGDLKPLYEYLTGDTHDVLYREVSTSDAVHEMLVSNPTALLDALRPMF